MKNSRSHRRRAASTPPPAQATHRVVHIWRSLMGNRSKQKARDPVTGMRSVTPRPPPARPGQYMKSLRSFLTRRGRGLESVVNVLIIAPPAPAPAPPVPGWRSPQVLVLLVVALISLFGVLFTTLYTARSKGPAPRFDRHSMCPPLPPPSTHSPRRSPTCAGPSRSWRRPTRWCTCRSGPTTWASRRRRCADWWPTGRSRIGASGASCDSTSPSSRPSDGPERPASALPSVGQGEGVVTEVAGAAGGLRPLISSTATSLAKVQAPVTIAATTTEVQKTDFLRPRFRGTCSTFVRLLRVIARAPLSPCGRMLRGGLPVPTARSVVAVLLSA